MFIFLRWFLVDIFRITSFQWVILRPPYKNISCWALLFLLVQSPIYSFVTSWLWPMCSNCIMKVVYMNIGFLKEDFDAHQNDMDECLILGTKVFFDALQPHRHHVPPQPPHPSLSLNWAPSSPILHAPSGQSSSINNFLMSSSLLYFFIFCPSLTLGLYCIQLLFFVRCLQIFTSPTMCYNNFTISIKLQVLCTF